jgi:hypothetical protein
MEVGRMKLGEVLLRKQLVSRRRLEVILHHQECYGRPLGELLLEKCLISHDDLAQALREQQWRKDGWWVIEE